MQTTHLLDKSSLEAYVSHMVQSCLNCGQCSLTCPTHFAGLFNPMGVLRDIHMSGIQFAIEHQPIYNCLTCNRCTTGCPDGLNFAVLIRSLRQISNEEDHPILTVGKAISPGVGAVIFQPPLPLPKTKGKLGKLLPILDVQQYFPASSKLQITDSGSIAYFVGDLPYYHETEPEFAQRMNLCEIPQKVVRILNQLKIIPVVLDMKGSGHDDFWSGHQATFTALAEYNVAQYRRAGVKTIIIEDVEAYRTWKYDYPKIVPDFEFEVVHLSEFLMQDHQVRLLPLNPFSDITFTYQDSSRMGRLGGRLYEAPRILLSMISQGSLVELESNREFAYDCGAGLYLTENQETHAMWLKWVRELGATGAAYAITNSVKSLRIYDFVTSKLQSTDSQDPPVQIPLMYDFAVFLSRFLH